MCGIAGVYSNNLIPDEQRLFELLLMMNVLRGVDSTGIIKINKTKKKIEARTQRSLLPSPVYIHDKESKFLEDKASIGYIGHCRAATVGEVKLHNAHPFRFKNVVGVHNGTIKKKFRGTSDFETDSEALYNLINEDGIESALNEVADYDTAYALAYVDLKTNDLCFVKNSKRPLYFTFVYNKSTLVWSSEKKTLQFGVEYAEMHPDGWSDDTEDYFTLGENQLLRVPLGKKPTEATITRLDVETPKYYTYTGHSSFSKGGTNTGASTGGYRSNGSGGSSFPPFHGNRNTGGSAANLPVQHNGYDAGGDPDDYFETMPGLYFRRAVFAKKLSQGCMCCSIEPDIREEDELATLRWFDADTFVCEDCYNDSPEDWVKNLFHDMTTEGDKDDDQRIHA